MESDTEDERNSTGSSSALRVAGLATLQQVPARVFLGKLGRESQKAVCVRNGPAMPRYKRKGLGLTFEPFANLSPPFRELSPTVFLHHVFPCLYILKHGFLDDPHVGTPETPTKPAALQLLLAQTAPNKH